LDVITIFEDIGGEPRTRDGNGGTDIGEALALVQQEIDDIATATYGSITLETLLKTMEWRKARDAKQALSENSAVLA